MEDLTGKTIEMWKVLGKAENPINGWTLWKCQCSCSNQTIKILTTSDLKKTKSCGCLRKSNGASTKIDLMNQRFNSLVVIGKADSIDGNAAWLCQCDCGSEPKIIRAAQLKNGKTKTCGCKIGSKDPKLISAKSLFKKKYNDGNLTFEEFYELSQKNCIYCNIEPNNCINSFDKNESQLLAENNIFVYNGLGKIDYHKDYDKDNVVPCCRPCNTLRSFMTDVDFKEYIVRAFNFINSEKENNANQ